ncbi:MULTISPECIES: hypothetical protein [unclassified Burkholderia]|uniref:hypothetical protein n=1 Tax=unclassified Burkholderia TaxID=2613784 RepID=UPI0015C6752F|nr:MULTISPECIES: hypothetical protein [unclassified Burkholderia]
MSNEASPAQSANASQSGSPSAASRASRAASVSAQLPPEPPSPCFRCHQEIYQSFFFDGFAQGLKDLDHPSNILRLFNAHEETNDERGIYKMYYDGMGRDLAIQTVGTDKKVASDIASTAEKMAKDKLLKGPANAVAGDIRQRAMNDAGDKGLLTRARSAILEGTAAAGTTAKNNIKDSFSLKKTGSRTYLVGCKHCRGLLSACSRQRVRCGIYGNRLRHSCKAGGCRLQAKRTGRA